MKLLLRYGLVLTCSIWAVAQVGAWHHHNHYRYTVHGTVPYGVPMSVVPYGVVSYGVVPYGAVPYGAMPYSGVPSGGCYGSQAGVFAYPSYTPSYYYMAPGGCYGSPQS